MGNSKCKNRLWMSCQLKKKWKKDNCSKSKDPELGDRTKRKWNSPEIGDTGYNLSMYEYNNGRDYYIGINKMGWIKHILNDYLKGRVDKELETDHNLANARNMAEKLKEEETKYKEVPK